MSKDRKACTSKSLGKERCKKKSNVRTASIGRKMAQRRILEGVKKERQASAESNIRRTYKVGQ
jgi:hypothetical protein